MLCPERHETRLGFHKGLRGHLCGAQNDMKPALRLFSLKVELLS